MYGAAAVSELKKWMRDQLMSFMVLYPILFGMLGRFLVPVLEETGGLRVDLYGDAILAFLVLMTPQVYGAILGFSILEDRDDQILTSIRVTPLSLHHFLVFRFILGTVLCALACLYVIWFSDIVALTLGQMVAISLLASLAAPATGLLINMLATNKIEGFAVMKGIGTILVFPIVGLFFFDAKELFFAFAPGFWPAKAISSLFRGEGLLYLTYNQYYFIGLAYTIFMNVVTYRYFLKRTET